MKDLSSHDYVFNHRKQAGNILVMFTVSLLAIIIMVSLALDGSHLIYNKGRLQNIVDSAALHAAKELDDGATQNDARQAVVDIIRLNLAHADNHELESLIDITNGNIDITTDGVTNELSVEFSLRPDPFIVDYSTAAKYVKVTLAQLTLDNFLADVMNFDKQVSATALAGPSTHLEDCFDDLVPLLVCANDPDDALFGFIPGELHMMKMGATGSSPIGPGNFQLIRLDGNAGAADIKAALAGEVDGESCFSTGVGNATVPTEPGNKVGPVADGLNTRMGIWPPGNNPNGLNAVDHPRDTNLCQGDHIALDASGEALEASADTMRYAYSTYETEQQGSGLSCSSPATTGDIVPESNDVSDTAFIGRRILNVVIGTCTGESNGQNDLDYLGVGCFFLTQETIHTGTGSYIVGEFIDNCTAEGVPSGDALDTNGLYKIVLYHVIGSTDS